MFTLYTINSKSYYLPIEEISTVTEDKCVQKKTSDGRVIHVLRDKLPGFLKEVFDELHLYSFDQLKYEIDPHRIHNRLSTFLTLPPDILRKIISYTGSYETLLAVTCQKFRNMVLNSRLSMWAAAANAGDLKLLLALKPKPAQIQTICQSALNGSRATEEDRLNILEHFYNQKKYDLKKLPLEKAAANGDLKILQWAIRSLSTIFSKAWLPEKAICEAIINGHLPILIWAEKEGVKFYNDSFRTALNYGRLNIIEWMHKKGLSTFLDSFAERASQMGYLHVMEWGYMNGYNRLDSNILRHGASLNRVDILQWTYDRGVPLPPDLCDIAVLHGHLEVLEWAHNKGFSIEKIESLAAVRGQLKILQWIVDKGKKIDEDICLDAAASGQLAVLQWAQSKNVKLNSTICTLAALSGHLHILQWAKESGAPMDLNAICEAAVTNRRERVIHWAIQNGLDRGKGQRALLAIKTSLGE